VKRTSATATDVGLGRIVDKPEAILGGLLSRRGAQRFMSPQLRGNILRYFENSRKENTPVEDESNLPARTLRSCRALSLR
jgi:hypothetical protein